MYVQFGEEYHLVYFRINSIYKAAIPKSIFDKGFTMEDIENKIKDIYLDYSDLVDFDFNTISITSIETDENDILKLQIQNKEKNNE